LPYSESTEPADFPVYNESQINLSDRGERFVSDLSEMDNDLLERAAGGDERAVGELFERYRARLRRMVLLRLDRRLQGRVDASDVLQDSYLVYSRRLNEYVSNRPMPFFLWLRLITGQKLTDLHRLHLGTKMRTVTNEVSLHRGNLPNATSISLAEHLLGKMTTPSQAVSWAETKLRVQDALNRMDPIDREVLALRHFEGLENKEVAEVLDLKPTAASNRYIRALKRIKEDLLSIPGFSEFAAPPGS